MHKLAVVSRHTVLGPWELGINWDVEHVIAVGSGKGGVGKSSVTVLLAQMLAQKGILVGIIDADVYGPSLATMLRSSLDPRQDPDNDSQMLPGYSQDIAFMSVAQFRDTATIVRAPIANETIKFFAHSVNWGKRDILLIDLPPGTADVHLTIMQQLPISAAIVVTTPQDVAVLDARKAVELFQSLHIPVMGIVENMSFWRQEKNQEPIYLFGKEGGKALAEKENIPLLAQVPIEPSIAAILDRAGSFVDEATSTEAWKIYSDMAQDILERIEKLNQTAIISEVFLKEGVLHFCKDRRDYRVFGKTLQAHCPCAQCQRQKGNRDKKSFDPEIVSATFWGRYALKMTFSSGCSLGIYPLKLIETLGIFDSQEVIDV